MIGMVLVTHGALADEFKSALEHVVGPQEGVEAIAIGPDDDMEQRREDILAAVERADQGQGVVILTDMFGGTPSNLAISVMQNRQVEVIAGVNLPMLVKLGRVRGGGGFVGARGARAVRPGGAWALVLRLDGGWTRLLPEASRQRRVCGGVDVGARRRDGPALLCTRSVR